MASKADFVIQLIDKITAPAKAAARALAGMERAQKAVSSASKATQAAMVGAGAAAQRAGQQAARGAAGMQAMARAMRATQGLKGAGGSGFVKLNSTAGPSVAMGGLSESLGKLMAWNRGAGETIAKWGEMRAAFMGTPFGFLAGGLGGLAMLVGKLALGLAEAAAKAAALALAMGGIAALGITKMVVEMGAFAERSKTAFGFLLGDKALGAQAFERGRELAMAFNLDVEETVQQMIKLRSMQFSIPEAEEIIKISTDLKAISGDAEAAHRAITAITQIKAKGKLQSEELVGQLAEAGVSTVLVYEELGKKLGKSRAEVIKTLQAGKIDSETGIEAIMAAIRHKVGTSEAGEAGKAFAQTTIAGLWEGLTNLPKQLALDVSKFVNLTPVRDAIASVKSAMNSIQTPAVGDFVNSMIRGLGSLIDIAVEFGKGFGESFSSIQAAMGVGLDTKGIAEFARTAGKWMAEFFASAILWGKAFVATIQEMIPVLQKLWDIGARAFNAISIAIAPLMGSIVATLNSLRLIYGLIESKTPKKSTPGAPSLPIDPRINQGVGPLVNAAPLVDAGGFKKRSIQGRVGGQGQVNSGPAVAVNRIDVQVVTSGDPQETQKSTVEGLLEGLGKVGAGNLLSTI